MAADAKATETASVTSGVRTRNRGDLLNLIAQGILEIADGSSVSFATDASDRTIVVGPSSDHSPSEGSAVIAGSRARSSENKVDEDDAKSLLVDLVGKLVTKPYCLPGDEVAGSTSDITTTDSTEVIAAPPLNEFNYITHLTIMNSHATVSTWVDIKDGATTIYTAYAASAGGGVSVTLPVPLRLTTNTALNAQCATTGANVRVSASGYTSLA